jgi:hypothetical protein
MTEVQLFLIATLASAIVYAVKLSAQYLPPSWAGFVAGRKFLTVFLYVVAAVLAAAWSLPSFDAFPAYAGDPTAFVPAVLAWLSAGLVTVSPFFAFATLIYNLLAKQVFEKMAEKIGLL